MHLFQYYGSISTMNVESHSVQTLLHTENSLEISLSWIYRDAWKRKYTRFVQIFPPWVFCTLFSHWIEQSVGGTDKFEEIAHNFLFTQDFQIESCTKLYIYTEWMLFLISTNVYPMLFFPLPFDNDKMRDITLFSWCGIKFIWWKSDFSTQFIHVTRYHYNAVVLYNEHDITNRKYVSN